MKYSDQSYNLRIELDTENYELTEAEIAKFEEGLSPLRKPVEDFPVASLYLTIQFHSNSNQYRVKAVLQLPGKGLATGDVDEELYPAFRRCVRKLVKKVSAYKERMEETEALTKHEKGTRHDVVARREIDPDRVRDAVAQGDYATFRQLMYPFEEPLRKRIGRWIQRYPRIEAQLGRQFDLADLVEEVFLNAFERYDQHPREVPFGDWLENLIDPSVRLLSEDTEAQLTNIRFVRSAVEAEQERGE